MASYNPMFMDALNESITPFNAFLTHQLSQGTPYLLPDIDVTRSFSNAEDATTYMRGPEFQRRFNPSGETHLGIRADFQGIDRDVRLSQSAIDTAAANKVDALNAKLASATTEAERLAITQSINQIQNRAWYSKRFYTDLNTPTGVADVNYYLRKGLGQTGAFVDSSMLTAMAGSNPAEMVPLVGQQAFGGTTADFNLGQSWIKDFKKNYNFPQMLIDSGAKSEAKAASYLSTNPASELFPTAEAITKYGKPAGTIDVDRMMIDLYGTAKNPLVYGMKPPSTFSNLAGKAAFGAGLLLDAPEFTAKEDTKRRSKYPEGYTGSREATASEVAQMLGVGTSKSVLNAFTMGMAYAGAGEGNASERKHDKEYANWLLDKGIDLSKHKSLK
jgi:hypothetical protein